MIYGKRWHIEFQTVLRGLCTIDIFQKNYTGSVEQLTKYGEEPLATATGANSDNPYEQLIGSDIVLKLIAEKRLQFIEMQTADRQKHYCEVKYDGVLEGKYWFVADLYQEPYNQPPIEVQLTAVDGIGLLKYMTFDLRGNHTMKESLLHILNKIGLNLPIDITCAIVENSASVVNFIDTKKQYAYLNDSDSDTMCDEILKSMLLSMQSRMYQQEGKWVIEQIAELSTTHSLYHYDSNFNFITFENVDSSISTTAQRDVNFCKLKVDNAKLDALPAWKKFEVTQNRYANENAIKGGTITEDIFFDHVPGDDYATLPVWVYDIASDDYIQEDREVYIGGLFWLNNWACEAPARREEVDGTLYWTMQTDWEAPQFSMENENLNLLSTDKDRFRLKLEFCVGRKVWEPDGGVFYRGNAKCTIQVKVQLGDLYLSDKGWTTVDSTVEQEAISEEFGEVFDITVDSYSVPRSGVLKITVFSASFGSQSEYPETPILYVKNIGLYFLNDEGNSLPDTITNTVTVDSRNNLIPSTIELDFIDLPDTPNTLNAFSGGMLLPSGKHTKQWLYNGKEDTIANLMILQYVAAFAVPRFKISCSMYSDILKFGSILSDIGSADRKFMMSKGTYYARSSRWEGCQWLELPTYPVQGNLEAMFIGSVSDTVLNMYGPNATDDGDYIIFPQLTKDVFNISNTNYWHADFQNLSGFDINQPRRWKKTWLSGPEIIEYALPEVQKYLFFKDIEEAELQTSMPIMVYSTDQTANIQTIEEFLSGYFWLYDGTELIEDNGSVLTKNI